MLSHGQDKQDVKINLQNLARQHDLLVLWLDCDREGENIAFEVVEVCREVNHRIKVKRARFSALTYHDLTNACRNLQDPNVQLSAAVDARQEIDLRIGAAFTRFQTISLRGRFDGVDGVVSYGCVSYQARRLLCPLTCCKYY